MSHLVRARDWIRFLMHAKTKFSVHSPFVYDLIVNVLENRFKFPEYKDIEKRADQLKHDPTSITRTVLGARQSGAPELVKISKIARSECVNREFGRLLFRMVQKFKPANILELGTSLGISASYMACARRDCKIFSVEGCREIAMIAIETLNITAPGQAEIIDGNFDMVLPDLLQRIGPLDLVFIDGNHRKEPVLNYFGQILPKMHNDSVIIFDDIHWSAEMEDAWSEICAHEKVKVSIDLFQLGMVFFKKELTKEDFVLRYS